MKLNENEEDYVIINILFSGKIKSLKCNYYMDFKEILKLFVNEYLKSNIDLDNLTFKVNEKECLPEELLEFYKKNIEDNCIFELSRKKVEENKKNNFVSLNSSENKLNLEENKDLNDRITIVVYKPILKNKLCRDINKNLEYIPKPIKPIFAKKEEENNKFDLEINIKFSKTYQNFFHEKFNSNLFGILKLCLLKEIALISDCHIIENLPDYISNIMTILKKGEIKEKEAKEDLLQILKKIKGGNIINFSKYVDDLISQSDINKYLISQLNEKKKSDIIYIQNCLGKYVEYAKKFEQEFERAKKNSIFEYSIISLSIIEREDINKFERNREKCENRVDRILFHGTTHDSIPKILTDIFKKAYCIQHGEGVYFTEDLDSCWIYGSEKINKNLNSSHRNLNIPKIGEFFSFIASAIYYNKYGFKRVYNNEYNPKKNEINFALAEMEGLNTVLEKKPDKTKFYSTEYVINHLDQIFPFMSLKLKRDEYCVIWRDNNFSSKPVYGNKFDKIFKKFLKERMKYINQIAKFNIYPCETSKEALNLIKRKKYNKIILLSNIGTNLEGKQFIIDARKIIGNNVIVLFLAYNTDHLNWIKKFPNSLFSNEPNFYEKYLDCFYDKNEKECKEAIFKLKKKMEKHYGVKFNLDDKCLEYPFFNNKKLKKFSDLSF